VALISKLHACNSSPVWGKLVDNSVLASA
jgi:hypothetical protein